MPKPKTGRKVRIIFPMLSYISKFSHIFKTFSEVAADSEVTRKKKNAIFATDFLKKEYG